MKTYLLFFIGINFLLKNNVCQDCQQNPNYFNYGDHIYYKTPTLKDISAAYETIEYAPKHYIRRYFLTRETVSGRLLEILQFLQWAAQRENIILDIYYSDRVKCNQFPISGELAIPENAETLIQERNENNSANNGFLGATDNQEDTVFQKFLQSPAGQKALKPDICYENNAQTVPGDIQQTQETQYGASQNLPQNQYITPQNIPQMVYGETQNLPPIQYSASQILPQIQNSVMQNLIKPQDTFQSKSTDISKWNYLQGIPISPLNCEYLKPVVQPPPKAPEPQILAPVDKSATVNQLNVDDTTGRSYVDSSNQQNIVLDGEIIEAPSTVTPIQTYEYRPNQGQTPDTTQSSYNESYLRQSPIANEVIPAETTIESENYPQTENSTPKVIEGEIVQAIDGEPIRANQLGGQLPYFELLRTTSPTFSPGTGENISDLHDNDNIYRTSTAYPNDIAGNSRTEFIPSESSSFLVISPNETAEEYHQNALLIPPIKIPLTYLSTLTSSGDKQMEIPLVTSSVMLQPDLNSSPFKIATGDPCLEMVAWLTPVKKYKVSIKIESDDANNYLMNVLPKCKSNPRCTDYTSNPDLVENMCRSILTKHGHEVEHMRCVKHGESLTIPDQHINKTILIWPIKNGEQCSCQN